MMRIVSLDHYQDLQAELARIGVDPAAWNIFAAKSRVVTIKLEGLSAATANILKQTALITGADCAIHRQVISGRKKKSDAILFATPRSIDEICLRLEHQPACAARLVPELKMLTSRVLNPPAPVKIKKTTLNFSQKTLIMGILNVTPDSFYDGGRFFSPAAAIEQGLKLSEEGADIIDIGAESTRPGSNPVAPQEQLRRLLPVLRKLGPRVRVPISVDTTSARVAEAVLKEGATIINDISGLKFDPKMAEVCARANAKVIVMHIKGKPKTMQKNPVYKDLMQEIIAGLARALARGIKAGIRRPNIFIDPGIGFGKKLEHNLEILRRLEELRSLGQPIVVGPSRKSFIGSVLNLPPEERLEGTITACLIAALKGANILRVHDVLKVKRALSLLDALRLAPATPAVGQGFSLASPSESKPEGLPYIVTLFSQK
jgi:dihydropteroate synthase